MYTSCTNAANVFIVTQVYNCYYTRASYNTPTVDLVPAYTSTSNTIDIHAGIQILAHTFHLYLLWGGGEHYLPRHTLVGDMHFCADSTVSHTSFVALSLEC